MAPLPAALEAALDALGLPGPRPTVQTHRPAPVVGWRPAHPNDEPPF